MTLAARDKEFQAHKIILSGRSPVFAQMFEHDMREKSTNKVEIEDIEPNTLKELISYIYTGKTPMLLSAIDEWNYTGYLTEEYPDEEISEPTVSALEVAKNLLYAADKYQIDGLVDVCEECLHYIMCADNAVEILLFADRHNKATKQL